MRRGWMLAGVVLVAAGCSSSGDESGDTTSTMKEAASDTTEGGVDVVLTMTPTFDGVTVTIAGTANLPDGTIIGWDVESASVDDTAVCADVTSCWRDGTATLSEGAFSAAVDVASFPADGMNTWVGVNAANQPADVLKVIGDNGCGMTGPQVRNTTDDPDDAFCVAELEVAVG